MIGEIIEVYDDWMIEKDVSDNEILHFPLALAVLPLHHLSARTRYLVPHLTQKFTHTALSFLLFICRSGLFSLDAVAEVLLLH